MCEICNCDSKHVGSKGIVREKCGKAYHPTAQCTGLYKKYIEIIQREGPYDAMRNCCNACRCSTNSSQARSLSKSGNDDSETSNGSDSATVSHIFVMVKSVAKSVASLTAQVAALAALG